MDLEARNVLCSYLFLSGFKEIEINKKLIHIFIKYNRHHRSHFFSCGLSAMQMEGVFHWIFFGYKFSLHQMLCQWNQCFIPVCTEKEYHCDNDRCLTPRQVCDGTEDCRDGADESDCGKKYKLVNKSTNCAYLSYLHTEG